MNSKKIFSHLKKLCSWRKIDILVSRNKKLKNIYADLSNKATSRGNYFLLFNKRSATKLEDPKTEFIFSLFQIANNDAFNKGNN